jgi:hypothetical protein
MLAFARWPPSDIGLIESKMKTRLPEKNEPPTQKQAKSIDLIRWSMQEIRRIAVKPGQLKKQPASIIAWSIR